MSLLASPLPPMALALAGYVAYHLAQKNVPAATPPLVATAVAYAVGLAACLATITASGGWSQARWSQVANGPTLAVGAAIVAIELGFLLAYRAGGALSSTSLWVTSLGNVVLFLLAVWWAGEKVDASRVIGAVLCVVGVVLLTRD
jgi:drug/metabolite transporter (DMT)-like permease